jgi:hypothetical protein
MAFRPYGDLDRKVDAHLPPDAANDANQLILIRSLPVAVLQRDALIVPILGETFRARLGLV